MLELIKYVVNQFAENSENVEYNVEDRGNRTEITVILDASDMGKVIGRQGKLAKALRTLVKAYSQKENKRYVLEIKERAL